MTLMEAAAWASIVAAILAVVTVFLTIAVPFLKVVSGRQRELRQELRRVLDPLVAALAQYNNGIEDALTQKFVKKSAESLRVLSEREGLKAPNWFLIDQLRQKLLDIEGRFDIPDSISPYAFPPEERAQLLQNNQDHFARNARQSHLLALWMLRATHAIDNFNYRIYRQCKRFGVEDWTAFKIPGNGRTKKGK